MSRNARVPIPVTTLDQDSTLVVVLELSARSWLVGARVPGCQGAGYRADVALCPGSVGRSVGGLAWHCQGACGRGRQDGCARGAGL